MVGYGLVGLWLWFGFVDWSACRAIKSEASLCFAVRGLALVALLLEYLYVACCLFCSEWLIPNLAACFVKFLCAALAGGVFMSILCGFFFRGKMLGVYRNLTKIYKLT